MPPSTNTAPTLRSTQLEKDKEPTTVGDILAKYIRPINKPVENPTNYVRCMREVMTHVLALNGDIRDVEVTKGDTPKITEEIDKFLTSELSETMERLERQAAAEGREITDTDIAKAIPDEKLIELAQSVHRGVFEAVKRNNQDQN